MKSERWITREPFNLLPPNRVASLKAAARGATFSKGEVLFREREPGGMLWIVESGWVRLKRRITESRELTLDIVTPREGICGFSAFFGEQYMATAIAATPLEVVQLPSSALKALMKGQSVFTAHLAQMLNKRCQYVTAAYSVAFAPVEQRVTSVLARLYDDFGEKIPVTRQEIAEMAGTTVETAIRLNNQMKKEQMLSLQRGQVTLLDPQSFF